MKNIYGIKGETMEKGKKVTVKLTKLQKSIIYSALTELNDTLSDHQIPNDVWTDSGESMKEIDKAISDLYKQLEANEK
jgi:hypothetical protein